MISIVSKGSIRFINVSKSISQRSNTLPSKVYYNSLPSNAELAILGMQPVQTRFFSEKVTTARRMDTSIGGYIRGFNQFTKIKLGVLNTIVTFTTYLVKGGSICLFDCVMLAAGTQMMAMASQGLNQIIEVEQDKKMNRTRSRPMPQGKFSKVQAYAITAALYGGSNLVLGYWFPFSSVFVANSIFWSYILCYTPLKRVSELNTPIGAVVGSLTAYLGWTAAGGSLLSLTPWWIFFYTFSWQFAHFYGILWTYKDDYKKAGFVMLQDSQKACNIMRAALAGQVASVGGIYAVGAIDPLSAALSWYLLYKYNYRPMKEFEKSDSKTNAHKLTIYSYIPFTTIFVLIYLNLVAKTFGIDKKIEEYLGQFLPKQFRKGEPAAQAEN